MRRRTDNARGPGSRSATAVLLAVLALGLALVLGVSTHASLAIGVARGTPCAVVSVPIALELPENAFAAQFELAFPAGSIAGIGFSNSPAFGKQRLDAWPGAAGTHRVIVWAPNGKTLPRQGVVNVTFAIATNAAVGTNEISATELLISDAGGESLAAGNLGRGSVVVIGPGADPLPPSVSISVPGKNAAILSTDGLVTVRGRVTDNLGVCTVQWRLNGGPPHAVPAVPEWETRVQARPGSNWLEVTAFDVAGLQSVPAALSFSWKPAHPVVVRRVGGGRVTGVSHGQILEIGRRYAATAVPDKGWLFAGWSGGEVWTNSATVSFLMQSNAALRATFVTNRFPSVAGNWSGLVRETPLRPESSGLLTVRVTPAGAFSAKLILDGATMAVRGRIGAEGRYRGIMARPKGAGFMHVELELPLGTPAGALVGAVSSSAWTAAIEAYRNPSTVDGTALAESAGRFTAILPHVEGSPVAAMGDGALVLTIGRNATVTGSGTLGDTTALTFAARSSAEGLWPIYAPLHGNRGVLAGWVSLVDEPGSDLYGDELEWIKPAGVGGVDAGGFTNVIVLDGSRYEAARPAVPWRTGTAWLAGGNLPAPVSQPIGFEDGRLSSPDNIVGLGLTLSGSGALSGAFTSPITGMRTPLRGVIHQKRGEAAGNFAGTNASGRLFIEGD